MYRTCDIPEYVYVLLDGNIKLEKSGFSQRKLMDNVILGPLTMFGDRDIQLYERQTNAVCCSAFCKLLLLPKKYKIFNAETIFRLWGQTFRSNIS